LVSSPGGDIEVPYRACAGKTSAAEDVAYYKRNVQIEEKLPNDAGLPRACAIRHLNRFHVEYHMRRSRPVRSLIRQPQRRAQKHRL
jgi:hypothetical protein